MKLFMLRLGWLLAMAIPLLPAMAQYQQGNPDEEAAAAAAGCAICAGGCLVYILIIVAIITLNILLLVWVARDAKNRGMDTPVLWILLVAFTGLIGLIVYLLSRTKGDLVPCPHCGNP